MLVRRDELVDDELLLHVRLVEIRAEVWVMEAVVFSEGVVLPWVGEVKDVACGGLVNLIEKEVVDCSIQQD